MVWHLAVLRAIVHAASTEIRGGRISASKQTDVYRTERLLSVMEKP